MRNGRILTEINHLLGFVLPMSLLLGCTSRGQIDLTARTGEAIPRDPPSEASPKRTLGETPMGSVAVPMDVTPFSTPAPLTAAAMASCPVTFPNGSQPPRSISSDPPSPHLHGNGSLWTGPGAGGKIIPAPEQFNTDGSLNWKMGWDRGVPGELTVTGIRLDAHAPPAVGHYDISGYGQLGFQAGWVYFPSVGCWELTGRVGDADLSIVILLLTVPFEYVEPAWLPEGLNIKDQDITALPESFRLVFGRPVVGEDFVTWDEGELYIETAKGSLSGPGAYPSGVSVPVTVNGHAGICARGGWDGEGNWRSGRDVGILEWETSDLRRIRISHSGLGLDCDDLLRIAGAAP
jgi:hypothetical protein